MPPINGAQFYGYKIFSGLLVPTNDDLFHLTCSVLDASRCTRTGVLRSLAVSRSVRMSGEEPTSRNSNKHYTRSLSIIVIYTVDIILVRSTPTPLFRGPSPPALVPLARVGPPSAVWSMASLIALRHMGPPRADEGVTHHAREAPASPQPCVRGPRLGQRGHTVHGEGEQLGKSVEGP